MRTHPAAILSAVRLFDWLYFKKRDRVRHVESDSIAVKMMRKVLRLGHWRVARVDGVDARLLVIPDDERHTVVGCGRRRVAWQLHASSDHGHVVVGVCVGRQWQGMSEHIRLRRTSAADRKKGIDLARG